MHNNNFFSKIFLCVYRYFKQVRRWCYCRVFYLWDYGTVKNVDIKKTHQQYDLIVERLKLKVSHGEKIKCAFLVSLSSMFSAQNLFKAMLNDNVFEPSIIILADLRFGREKAISIQKQAIQELQEFKKYMRVVNVDKEKDNLVLSEIADIAVVPMIYNVSHEKYNLQSLILQNLLPIHVDYCSYVTIFERWIYSSLAVSLFWKIFVDTKLAFDDISKHEKIEGRNLIYTGYIKLDSLQKYTRQNKQKCIIIAPHHSVEGGFNNILLLSNFLKYSALFLKLPKLYPDVKFIFRPHPALFTSLIQHNIWSNSDVEDYINALTNNANVTYSTSGDYFQDFMNSDGIIQDCVSYLVEYFFVNKPQCYLLKTKGDIKRKFLPLGREMLQCCYISYNAEQIISFINEVILCGNDYLKNQRIEFSQKFILGPYPKASEKSLEYLKSVFINN